MKPIDPLQLQRLVDGELDDVQVQVILGDATSLPDQWQDIAIGYIENQLWCKTFQSQTFQSGEIAGSDPSDSAKSPVGASIESGPAESDSPISNEAMSNKPRPAYRRSSNFSWLIMAASLLVASTMGYMAHQITNRTIPSTSLAKLQPQPSVNESLPGPMLAQAQPSEDTLPPQITRTDYTPPDYHLELSQDSEPFKDMATSGTTTSVPLFRIGNKNQLNELNERRNTPVLPPEVLEQLASSGYQVEQRVEFISGQLDGGQSFVVPVRTIRFLAGQ